MVLVEDDPHGFEEIRSTLSSGIVDAGQDLHGQLQPFGRFRLHHKLLGDFDGMKHHALAGPRNVRKQSMLDGIVLGAVVGRIMRHADFQSQTIREFLQIFLEDMLIGGVTAAAIAKQ